MDIKEKIKNDLAELEAFRNNNKGELIKIVYASLLVVGKEGNSLDSISDEDIPKYVAVITHAFFRGYKKGLAEINKN